MKKVLTITLFLSGLIFFSCSENKPADTADQTPTTTVQTDNAPTTTTTTAPTTGQSTEHYICPNGHVGAGGASQGTCSQCNAALVHNTAFHGNQPTQPTTTPATQGQNSPFANPADAPVITTPPAAAGGQNAKGVWHYTCAKGCEGGGGAAGNCAKCGGALAHNQAFHN